MAIRIEDIPGMDFSDVAGAERIGPVTPGEILKEEFLAGYRLSQADLARALGVPADRIADIVNDRRRISADTAVRLGLFFGNSAEFWLNLQTNHDLELARRGLPPAEAERIQALRATA